MFVHYTGERGFYEDMETFDANNYLDISCGYGIAIFIIALFLKQIWRRY